MQQAVSETGVTSQPPFPLQLPLKHQRTDLVSEGWHGSPQLCSHGFTHPGIISEALDGERKAWDKLEVTSTESLIFPMLIAAETRELLCLQSGPEVNSLHYVSYIHVWPVTFYYYLYLFLP